MYKDKEKEREKARERVRRYREKRKDKDVTALDVTPVTPKMICKCLYFKLCNGHLVCTQCGRSAPARKVEDKIGRGIEKKNDNTTDGRTNH